MDYIYTMRDPSVPDDRQMTDTNRITKEVA